MWLKDEGKKDKKGCGCGCGGEKKQAEGIVKVEPLELEPVLPRDE